MRKASTRGRPAGRGWSRSRRHQPILATLGIGGPAFSLAVQDTLANLFSGIWLVASKQIRAGDYVRLSNGKEGYVNA